MLLLKLAAHQTNKPWKNKCMQNALLMFVCVSHDWKFKKYIQEFKWRHQGPVTLSKFWQFVSAWLYSTYTFFPYCGQFGSVVRNHSVNKIASTSVWAPMPQMDSDWLYLEHRHIFTVPWRTWLDDLKSHVPILMANRGRAVLWLIVPLGSHHVWKG